MVKNKLILMVVAVLLIAIIVSIFPYSQKIDIKESTSIYKINDPEYNQPVMLSIDGRMNHYLFKPNRFVGQISVDTINFTALTMIDPFFYSGSATLEYVENEGEEYKFYTLGSLVVDKDFDQILITVNHNAVHGIHIESTWTFEEGYFISLPSEDRKSAFENMKEVSIYSEWLSKANWDEMY